MALITTKKAQLESLSAELKTIEETKQPYYIAAGVKTAIKLISFGQQASANLQETMKDYMEFAVDIATEEKRVDQGRATEPISAGALRTMEVDLTAAGFTLRFIDQVIDSATEKLSYANMLIVGAAHSKSQHGYLPSDESMTGSLKELRDWTMTFAHEMAEYGNHIDSFDTPDPSDPFELKVRKGTLHEIRSFTEKMMQSAIALIDSAIGSVGSLENLPKDKVKDQIEWLAAYGITASSLAKIASQMLLEAIGSLGSVTIVTKASEIRSDHDLYAGIKGLTAKSGDYRLN